MTRTGFEGSPEIGGDRLRDDDPRRSGEISSDRRDGGGQSMPGPGMPGFTHPTVSGPGATPAGSSPGFFDRAGQFAEDWLLPGPTSPGMIPAMFPGVGTLGAIGSYLAKQGHDLKPGPTPQDLREDRGLDGDQPNALKTLMDDLTSEEQDSPIRTIINRILSGGTTPTASAPSTDFNPLTYGQPGSTHAFNFFPSTGPSNPQSAFQ